jgi:hypothetical protein
MSVSPSKFKEGGAAKLKILNKNHHSVKSGVSVVKPRNKMILRVLERE